MAAGLRQGGGGEQKKDGEGAQHGGLLSKEEYSCSEE
jgi:hypothetical protein